MSDPNNNNVEDPDQELVAAQAAAAAAVTYTMTPMMNKWSKNGFGAPVSKQSGKFSKEESELVRKAVEEYCASKQISTARLTSECDHKAELKGAWMEIAKRLPHRSVQSIYRHGIRQLHPFKRGAWSQEECQMLVDLVQQLGKKWSAIQTKLNRSADSCRDKYREMSDDYVKGRWREQETEVLKRLIREQLQADPNADMKTLGKLVEEQNIMIPWSTISKRMGKRSRLSCFKKWQKLTGLYSPADEYKRRKYSDSDEEHATKRLKIDDQAKMPAAAFPQAPTAGAAAAMAQSGFAQAPAGAAPSGEYDMYSAKIADETVEAVGLPDTDTLVPNVREI